MSRRCSIAYILIALTFVFSGCTSDRQSVESDSNSLRSILVRDSRFAGKQSLSVEMRSQYDRFLKEGLESQSTWIVRTETRSQLSEQEREDQFIRQGIEFYITSSGLVDGDTISVRVRLVHFPSGEGWNKKYRGAPSEIQTISREVAADVRSILDANT